MPPTSLLQRLPSRRRRPPRATVPHFHRGPAGQAAECWDEACDKPHLSVAVQKPAWARRPAA